jgi:uncharacterized protein YbbC (DUF1343 family)
MVRTGLDIINDNFPGQLVGKRIGVLCHAPSITSDFRHITAMIAARKDCKLASVFGPQHGLSGQTQDNMIEWEGDILHGTGIPVYSLYGRNRKPTDEMLNNIDVLVIDLQDVGARLYTYIWTVKLCIEACTMANIPVWVLDRPNPIAGIWWDGPVLKEDHFSFVGGACIPLCHRMTMGEMALWVRERYYPGCDLKIVWMEGWHRNSFFHETGLPWVLPSPNMPALQTAIVYPGTVLIEALNISEGRGTTIPFELFGAPFLESKKLIARLEKLNLPGCRFREHDFIPTFNKFKDQVCHGVQIHVTDPPKFRPVETALEIFNAVIGITEPGSLVFNDPPYEYEEKLIPFDILSGDQIMRTSLLKGEKTSVEKERWQNEISLFRKEFDEISAYPE